MTSAVATMFVCHACGQRYNAAGYCSSDGNPLTATDDGMLGTEVGRYRLARSAKAAWGACTSAVQPAIGSRVAVRLPG